MFLLLPRPEDRDRAEAAFAVGLEAARRTTGLEARDAGCEEWVRAALLRRRNGTGVGAAIDPDSGNILLAAGSWFRAESESPAALLARYRASGPERLAEELEGPFLIAIADVAAHEVVLLTDLTGTLHGYLRIEPWGVALSTSSALLASVGAVHPDPVGCQEFLHLGTMYEDRTLYREVRKLEPATIHRFREGRLRDARRYWSVGDLAAESRRGREAVEAVAGALVAGVRRIGVRHQRPACDLTGGYDSRAVFASFRAAGVPCTTVVSGPPRSPDVLISKALAREFQVPHLHVAPDVRWRDVLDAVSLTDGECDPFEYARVAAIHGTLAARFEASVNGSFGELGRGYWWEILVPETGARRPLDAAKVARLRYATGARSPLRLPPEWRIDLPAHLAGVVGRAAGAAAGAPNTLQLDAVYLGLRMRHWQGRIASSTDRIWPCLSLFQLRSVLVPILETEFRLRRHSGLIRRVLLALDPRLAHRPLEHGFPPLPLSWRTLPHFWPVPGYYVGRLASGVLRRGRRFLPRGAGPRRSAGTPRSMLEREGEAELRALLDPRRMRLAEWLGLEALKAYFRTAADDAFCIGPWTRVAGLELTLRALGSAPGGRGHAPVN